jgi:DNA-binding transcriptional MerR regulator
LSEYAITPLYNIKAVVQATRMSPSTLRAWERRYNIACPQRSGSGYRLYSERDITIIRWLKTQVDVGMSISQAASWLDSLISEAGTLEQATLPTSGSGALATSQRGKVRDLATIQDEVIQALINYDEESAEAAIAEAFSIYPVEQVGDKLFIPLLQELAELRQRGDLSITAERFAGNYLCQRLYALLRSTPNRANGGRIWVGTACTAWNDACAPLMSIYLRRSGYHVNYLGQTFDGDEDAATDLLHEARRCQLDLLLFAAATRASADKIAQMTRRLRQDKAQPALIAFAGEIYARSPELCAAMPGVYVGASAQEVIENIGGLLAERDHGKKKPGKTPAAKAKAPGKAAEDDRNALTNRWKQH